MVTLYGKALRKMRVDRNERLTDMSARLGVSKSFLSAVENGKKKVPKTWLEKLSKSYQLTEKETRELKFAQQLSEGTLKIDLNGYSQSRKRLVFQITERLLNASETQLKEFLETVEELLKNKG